MSPCEIIMGSSASLKLLTVATLVRTSSALLLGTPLAPIHVSRQCRAAVCLSESAVEGKTETETSGVSPLLASVDEAEPEENYEIQPDDLPWQVYLKKAKREKDSEYLQWVFSEKAKEIFKKENPVNPVEEFLERFQGPLTTLAVISIGFYSIPIIQTVVKFVNPEAGTSS